MLNRMVPTWSYTPVCSTEVHAAGLAASIAKTSWSGRSKRTALFQLRPSSSSPLARHRTSSNWTIRPTSGAVTKSVVVLGPGLPPGRLPPPRPFGEVTPSPAQAPAPAKPSQTRFPRARSCESGCRSGRPPRRRCCRPLLTARRARRVAEQLDDLLAASPPIVVAERRVASKTQTSARPMPFGCELSGSPAPVHRRDRSVRAVLAAVRCSDEGLDYGAVRRTRCRAARRPPAACARPCGGLRTAGRRC